ncbi:MAG: MAPEG family protein [Sphingopyxis sp.]
MTLPITALTAAICAIMLLLTAMDTVRQRIRAQAAFGDHGDGKLISASRSHGNLAEHAPIAIILIGLLEMARAHHWALTGVACLFLFSRAMHIIGLYAPMHGKPPVPRQIGVMGTWLSLAMLIGWTLVRVVTING